MIPKLWPQERLLFELYAYPLRGRPGAEGFLDGIVESWVARSPTLRSRPAPTNERAGARLGVAVVRGLLLDLLATGGRAGVTDAYERFLARAAAHLASPGSGLCRQPQP